VTLTAEKLPISSFEVRLFGGFYVRVEDHPLPPLRSRREQWLLALLVLRQDRNTARDWLATTLWPDNDEPQALFYLRKSLSNLRQALGGDAARLLAPDRRSVRLNMTGASVDVLAFDSALTRAATAADPVVLLQEAISLYRGPLLPDCPEEWAAVERNQREQAYLAALERLAAHCSGQGDPAAAVRWLRLLIAGDPYRESAYGALMQALSACGDQAAVTVVYQELRARLRQDLNAAPASEIEALYRQLSRSERPAATLPPPAPDALPSRRHLPVPLSDLIGREEEITQILDWMKRRRLVTLVGTGGVGKTRLAIAVAEEAMPRFDAGVWFVDLAPLSEASLVPHAVVRALGLPEERGRSRMETLVEALASRSLLLVLDNCEHLADACAELIYALLSACPALCSIVTSRQALHVAGEQIYRVPSLSLPPVAPPGQDALSATQEKDPHVLMEYEAVRLFVDRASRVDSAFRLTHRNASAVVEICSQLDGIPLAIEMAAARLRSLSVGEIQGRLMDRFRLLTSGNRGVLPRQQTLRAAIDWSYDQLSEAESALLCRLSVFAGGWTREAAEEVCGNGEGGGWRVQGAEILDLLASLVDKSLVLRRAGEEQAVRYGIQETIRQYALERLEASGEHTEFRRRHRGYFLLLAEATKARLKGPEQVHAYAVFENEHDNLRAALTFCLQSVEMESDEAGLRLGSAMWMFWLNCGYMKEGREHLTALIAHPKARIRSQAGADALHAAAALANQQGDYASARTLHEQSLEICKELGYRHGIAVAYSGLGNVATDCNEYASAHTFYEESLAIHRALGNREGETATLTNLGRVSSMQGDFASSRTLHEQGLRLYREAGNAHGIANSLYHLGMVACCESDYAASRTYCQESLTIRRETANRMGIAETLNILAIVATNTGDFISARDLHEEGLAIQRDLGNQWGIAAALANLGSVLQPLGDDTRARTLLEEGLRIFRDLGDRRSVASTLEALASAFLQEQCGAYSSRLWGAASALRAAIGAALPPNQREGMESEIAAVREAMGKEAFAAAWEEGSTMSMEQSIKYAHTRERELRRA
jgi:predicted ATPase/DNA-binding SARP family transcriptional activator